LSHKISELWNSLSDELFAQVDDDFVDSFRMPGGANNRLAAWDPFDATMRYYKFILFEAARHRPESFYDLYRRLGDTNVGNPVSVKVKNLNINLDYLFSVDEFLFLDSAMDTRSIDNVIEIGAGFGRTCHALTRLLPRLNSYTIIDLPQLLKLSRAVLTRTVPDQIDKISFVDATDEDAWRGMESDLIINIDSFQEIPPQTIDNYYEHIIRNARAFYVKNPIGKYAPESVGAGTPQDPARLQDVFSLGYCRDVIDIFDEDALLPARAEFVAAYAPGPDWRTAAQAPMELVPYYHNTLYLRDA
jgi:putative sugar O-methyltransferase